MRVNLKKLGIIAAAGMVLSVALSIILLVFMIESETGFFYREYHTFGLWVCVLIFVISFAVAAASIFTGKKPNTEPPKSKAFGIANFIMGAAVVYESLFAQIGSTIPSWQILAQVAFGICSATLFVLNGLSEFGKGKISPTLELFFIFFWLVRLMIVFTSYIPVSTITENVFELAALCTSLVFFFEKAKMRNNITDGKNGKVLPLAFLAFMFCAIYSVPQIIVRLFIKGVEVHSSSVTCFTDLAMAIYIVTFILCCYTDYRIGAKADKQEPAEPEEIAAEGEPELTPNAEPETEYDEILHNYNFDLFTNKNDKAE